MPGRKRNETPLDERAVDAVGYILVGSKIDAAEKTIEATVKAGDAVWEAADTAVQGSFNAIDRGFKRFFGVK